MTASFAHVDLIELHRQLKGWLVESVYPLWWTRGADHSRGGFHERLPFDGTTPDLARRARLHPRQMCAFARAPALGWTGPAHEAVEHAFAFFVDHYRRRDGLYATLVAADGTLLDERAVLYDQAFALFGFANAYALLRRADCREAAFALCGRLHEQLRHRIAGFYESTDAPLPLLANSHMHLLEASLTWMELDRDPLWRELAESIVGLALDRFIDGRVGFVREYFDDDWRPVQSALAADFEPGHQFEWGTLLLLWSRSTQDGRVRSVALDLIERAERACVDAERGVVIDGLNVDGSVRDRTARLWPQTERLRAACAAFAVSDDRKHCDRAVSAARALLRYLATPTRGLWYDVMDVAGDFHDDSAPASSLYHLVTAIAELDRAVAGLSGRR